MFEVVVQALVVAHFLGFMLELNLISLIRH